MRRLLLLIGLLSSTYSLRPLTARAEAPAKALEFIENRGQWAPAARYAAPVPGGRLFVEAAGLTYALVEPIDFHPKERRATAEQLRGHAVQMRFVGAQPEALQPREATGEVRNYFCGNDPARWASQVGSYRELQYRQLWPGIDARLYENAQQHLEYDFELAAGTDPATIRMRYTGADALRLDASGALQVAAGVGSFTELAPQAWQLNAAGQRRPVACRYVLHGSEVSFQLGRYDHTRPLTIDPTVVFSSYTGSTADNWGFTATYDQQGNLYSGGIAFNLGFPASPGAFSTRFAGAIDMAVIKYNPATTGPAARVWATYLGGSSGDFPESLVVNNQGELVILGATGSSNFPTTANAYDRSFNGGVSIDPYLDGPPYDLPPGSDLVITRLSANGSALLGSTYLGGSNNDGLLDPQNGFAGQLVRNYGDPFRGDIIVDANDNIYIASNTASANFPASGGFGTSFGGGGYDAVVCKLNPGLTSLLWSSFLGGSGADAAYSLRLDAASNLYVCGGTSSTNFPTTAGALIPTTRGGVDGFVVRLSNTGSTLQRSTYLGTGSYDQAFFVQLDSGGDVYLLGQSQGSYPVTAGRYANAGSHQFVHRLNADLTATVFSTVFGSGRSTIDISPTAFLVDQCDRIYASGWGGRFNEWYAPNGNTAGMPVSAGALQPTTDGNDFYLIALSPDARGLDYATYFGANDAGYGDHVDGGTSRFDPRGVVYQSVCSCGSAPFPIPPSAGTYSPINGTLGRCNNVAFKFNFEISLATTGPSQTLCAAAPPLRLGGSPAGGTWAGPGVTGSVATGFFFTPSAALLGVQTLTYSYASTGLCSSQASLQITVTPAPTVAFAPLSQNQFCLSSSTLPPITLAAAPAGGSFSGRGVVGNQFFPASAGAGTHTLTYSYTLNGCTVQATQTATVVAPPTIVLGPDTVICAGSTQPIQLKARPAGGVWSGPNVSASGVFTPPPGFVGPVTLTYTAGGGCSASATRRIGRAVAPALAPSWTPIVCAQDQQAPLRVRFTGADAVPGARWDFGDSTAVVSGTTVEHVYTRTGSFVPRVTIPYNGGLCQQVIQLRPVVVVAPAPIPNVITPNNDQLNDRFVVGRGCPPQLQVFSRWGNKVYESAAYQNDWDGGTLPAGVYYYLLRVPGGSTTKGWLELVR